MKSILSHFIRIGSDIMRKAIKILSASDVVEGTNCGNCTFSKGAKAMEGQKLNEQGGTTPPDKDKMKLAKTADLVTLPGKAKPTIVMWCQNKKVDQAISDRMCCAYWDNPGAYRAFGKQAIGKTEGKMTIKALAMFDDLPTSLKLTMTDYQYAHQLCKRIGIDPEASQGAKSMFMLFATKRSATISAAREHQDFSKGMNEGRSPEYEELEKSVMQQMRDFTNFVSKNKNLFKAFSIMFDKKLAQMPV